jgi:Phage Tail Collar Domain/F5/8 type C domain
LYTLTYYGTSWRLMGAEQIGLSNIFFNISRAINEFGLDTNPSTSILTSSSNFQWVKTATTAITGFETTNPDTWNFQYGSERTVMFSAGVTLVHSSSFQLPSSSNIVTQEGDVASFRCIQSGTSYYWFCTNYYRKSGTPLVSDLSTGSISLFNENVTPSGWLWQNGAAISRTTYANLFAVIGTTYGAGDGSTTFNLPDDRYGDVFFDLTTGGTASGSSNAGGSEYIKAFDKNLTTWWLAGGGGTQYVQYDFGRSKLINYARFYDYPYPSGTVTHTVLGSTDNVTFTTLGSLAITYTSETQTWTDLPLTTSGSYRYLRMNVLYSGGTAGITEVQFGLKSKKFIKF